MTVRTFDIDAEFQADEPISMKIAGHWYQFYADPPASGILKFFETGDYGYVACFNFIKACVDPTEVAADTPDSAPRGTPELLATVLPTLKAHQITSMARAKPGIFNHLWDIYLGGDEDPTVGPSTGSSTSGGSSPEDGQAPVTEPG